MDSTYFKKYLEEHDVDLKKHFDLKLHCNLQLDPKDFLKFADANRHDAIVKWYHPRPFLTPESNQQMVNANWLGYNEHNTTETNWGLDPKHNSMLKELIGLDNFAKLRLDPKTTLVRLLEYKPGQILPLHSDGMEGFKRIYGKQNPTRFFVAVSDWDWGHVLQVHDNMVYNWKSGDTYIIPNDIFHTSANFGIAPKYTLTITGVCE